MTQFRTGAILQPPPPPSPPKRQALGECIGAALVLQEGLEPWQLQPKDPALRARPEPQAPGAVPLQVKDKK